MFNLKSIFFYFLAIHVTFIKFIKKIYFSTNIYNKSLISRTPQQFYFYPNPLLLNLITNYKNYLFKVNEIDPNIFWVQPKNIYEQKNLHNFLWLNLINRKSDSKSLQKIIHIWMMKNSKYKKNIWEISVTSKRIVSWIINVDVIINNCSFNFKRSFLNSIISQTNHLKKNIKFEKNYCKRLEILTALILCGLVFKEYEDNFNLGIKELEKLVKNYFDKDGFPLSRNPSDLIYFSKFLILIKSCIKDAQKYSPNFLDDLIEKNLFCIKNMSAPNKLIPLFNGGIEEDVSELEKFISELNYESKSKKKLIGGIQILKNRNSSIFFDVGGPPNKNFSSAYQAGPLSFEYYLDNEKIITNCGFGSNISSKAELLSRLTSAQSTVSINDTSVTKFERNKLVNKVFGNSIKNTFKIHDLDYKEENNQIISTASHNGYLKNFGCIHKRMVSLNKSTNQLDGYDELIKKKDGRPITYNLRFHLYPGLTAVKTMGGNSVVIQVNKNKSLIFRVKEDLITLEKSIFLGRNKILDNTCITISGNLVNKNKIIHWEIRKNI